METEGPRFQCDKCPKFFKAKNSLQLHSRMHKKPIGGVSCEVCNLSFDTRYDKTKHQCLIFGHSAFTFSKMISLKLSCCVWLCELKYNTHMCARSPIRLIWGMAQAPIRAYLPRDASTAAYLPMRAATTDSIRVIIGKTPSITQFLSDPYQVRPWSAFV